MARQAAQQKSLEQTFLQLEKLLMTIILSFWRCPRVFPIIFFIKLSESFKKDKFGGKQKTETFYIGTDPPLYRPSPTLLNISEELLQVEMTTGEQEISSPSVHFCKRPLQVEQKSCMSPTQLLHCRKYLIGKLMESKLNPSHRHFLLPYNKFCDA